MQEVSQQHFGIVGNEVELSVEHIMQMKVYLRHCFEYIDVCNTVLLPGQGNMVFYPRMASYQCKASVLSATGIISMVNVCFFDSICQVLYSLTEFWRYVVDDEEHLPLFPNYSICSCSIQQWHHMNGRHVATFSRWKRLRQEEQSHRT